MKYKKFAATALMAVAATGIAAGTSGAAPAAPAPAVQSQAAPAVQGADQGVNYAVQSLDKSIVASITGGAFSLDSDSKNVVVKNAEGQVVTAIPLKAQVGDKLISIGAAIDPSAQQLTLTPEVTPTADAVAAKAQAIGSQEWFFAELQRASLGAVIGAIIGFFFFGVGLPIGALVGLLIAGGPNLINAGVAYFSGQP
ncbi:hypothetical protein [Nocardia bovistercoris]|uniref:DUF8020 domain-containing protein n=1 Tax=Nocardia bovistercoris TaxID=2785916 RepID=A0A931N5S1_9NOCA|nr:hypothetical protein [Nocardia bovistercoris]MBH0779706.1 hypothetical protein [Nocardia bovistercoris]